MHDCFEAPENGAGFPGVLLYPPAGASNPSHLAGWEAWKFTALKKWLSLQSLF